jgi:hypothetical protein
MAAIFNPEWRDSNDSRKYPFADDASFVSVDGDVMPQVLLDASIYSPVAEPLSLTALIVGRGEATMQFGTDTEAGICTAVFSTTDAPDNVPVSDAYGRPAGVLVSESIRLAVFQTWRPGTYVFAPATMRLATTVCVPVGLPGVTGVTADGETATGDVILYAENGVVFTVDQSDLDEPVIRVDVVGQPLARRMLCGPGNAPLQYAGRNYLKTVNSIPGDGNGNFMLTTAGHVSPDNILRIYPTTEGLRIEAVGQSVGDT